MSPTVAKTIDSLIGREGKYVNHKSDRGGETIWGVTVATARASGYSGSMRDMPRATAVSIYEKKYWLAPHFDKVAELSLRIAEECFDTGVNMGAGIGARFLQQALNSFNRQGTDYPDVSVDDDIGPSTIAALRAYLDLRGDRGVDVMMKALNCLQGARYIEIGETRPPNEDFMFGWFDHRVAL